jgi:hypothetical protein
MEAWKNHYEKNIFGTYNEFELRLGKQTASGFKSDIGKDNYEKLLQTLQASKWDSVEDTNITDTIYIGGIRKSSTGSIIKKTTTYKNHIRINQAHDIRFAINKELPVLKTGTTIEMKRHKIRKSFRKQFYRFDITFIKNDNSYEIEMELVDIDYAKMHSFEYIIGNMVKIFCSLISSTNF